LYRYKLFVDGSLLGIGPGRGDDNSSTPYDVYDVSDFISNRDGAFVIGLQGFNPDRRVGKFLLETHITYANGSKTVHGTNARDWTAFDCSHVFGLGLRGYTGGAYRQPQETVNGQLYPHGWMARGFTGSWAHAAEQSPFNKRVVPKSTQAISISEQAPISLVQTAEKGVFFFDFGREIQASITLRAMAVPDELCGQLISVQLGESLRAPGELKFPGFTGNSFAASFVLGSGNFTLTTHEYMEFRFGTIRLVNASMAGQLQFELSAAVVRYPWAESDSAFASSSSVLHSVYELCQYTLKATSLDTYTDSNTRERLPYELDGFIAAKSRLLLQREFAWPRHSFLYNINYPTWPTEWHQITIKMAYLDWLVTGQKVILSRNQALLVQNTYAHFRNESTGLLTKPSPSLPTRDIVDWPPNSRDAFVFTRVNTVVNAYAAQTTRMLGELGITEQYNTSKALMNAMDTYLFDAKHVRQCPPSPRLLSCAHQR
jgi:alpha-L-rhamnosidase